MNAIPGNFTAPVATDHGDVCFHCGQAIKGELIRESVDGKSQAFCCTGCSAATLWINDAGLSDYYDLRTQQAPKAHVDSVDLAAWDHPDTLAKHARISNAGNDIQDIIISVQGMHCAACAWLIDRALSKQKGVS